MTSERAVELAQAAAIARKWPWHSLYRVVRTRRWVLVGPREWMVIARAAAPTREYIIMGIDDATGRVTHAYYPPAGDPSFYVQ